MKTAENVDSNIEGNPILQKLERALRTDGDFPTAAKVVTELRTLASDSTTSIAKITEVILSEPSLGTRVLHLVNSAYFQRAVPIVTVSQAVLQIGMRNLVDLCAGLVLMQKFIPAARRGGIFADNMKKSILTSLITSQLGAEAGESGVAERGYLAGTFYSLGHLLLAYYFPQVYEAAAKRAEARGYGIEQSVSEVVGLSRKDVTLAVIDALKIPQYYHDLLAEAYGHMENPESKGPNSALAAALKAADRISDAIVNGEELADIQRALKQVEADGDFTHAQLDSLVRAIPELFDNHCQLVQLNFFTLPDFVLNYGEEDGEAEGGESDTSDTSDTSDQVSYYLREIKESLRAGEPLSGIITSVMETMAFGLNFNRVVLMLADDSQTSLQGRMALGSAVSINPADIYRSFEDLSADYDPDIAAFSSGSPQIYGNPIFKDCWPFAALPIGAAGRSVGVIYADTVLSNQEEARPIDSRTEAVLSVLGDLLDQAVLTNN